MERTERRQRKREGSMIEDIEGTNGKGVWRMAF